MQHSRTDDLIVFLDKDPVETDESSQTAWRVLVVDDDPEVFEVTRFALSGTRVLDRELELVSLHSAAAAEEYLANTPDVAVILLDVVMESEDAGLRLVKTIREDLGLAQPRIILRTGQPGYAPELEVISNYDINDYRTKSELTRTRLLTSLIAAIRSFQQIQAMAANRHGLRKVIDATRELLTRSGIRNFAEGVMEQIEALFSVPIEGLIVVRDPQHGCDPVIETGTGRYAHYMQRPLKELVDATVRDHLLRTLEQKTSSLGPEGSYFFFDGSQCPIAAYVDATPDSLEAEGEVLHLFCQNIALCSDNLTLIERLRQLAYEDDLSGLPNRVRFLLDTDVHLRSGGESLVLGLVDLDHFNGVVENTGHEVGDQLIVQVAERLREAVRDSELALGRLAGDTFAISGPHHAFDAERIRGIFDRPFDVHGLQVPLTGTLGMAPLGGDCPDTQSSLSGAYTALKRAKNRRRGGCEFYSTEMSREQHGRIEILNGLREAIATQRFFLCFQPQLRLSDGAVVGCEALIRWRTADGRLIPPGRFIPVAESAGMIGRIGDWVMREASRKLRELHDLGWPSLLMAVNVSAEQLREADFLDKVGAVLEESGVPPASLKLEITETMAMEEIDLVLEVIESVKRLGPRFSLDDFGTGFSSLAYLRQLQLDQLKIDRSFVSGLEADPRSQQIAETIIQLARNLQLEVLAEGAETVEQVDWLRRLGCDSVQGYFFSKPLEFDDLLAWLRAR